MSEEQANKVKDPTTERIAGRKYAEELLSLVEIQSPDFALGFWRAIAKAAEENGQSSDGQAGKDDLLPMTDEEATYYERHEVLEFGMHRGKAYGEAPISYLVWLAESNLPLLKYVRSRRAQHRQETE